MSPAADAWIALTKQDAVMHDDAAAAFAALPAVTASFMTRGAGEWQGADLATDLVAGAMDSKKMNSFGTYYFYLKRLS